MSAILITGAAKRVGAALAHHFAAKGWDIGLHYHRSEAEAAALAASLRETGRRVALLPADLGDPEACSALVRQAFAELPGLCAVIHNASLFERDRLASLTAERLQAHLAVHLQAPLLLAQQFAALLPEGTEGNLIHLTDGLYGDSLSGAFFSYCVSKLALIEVTPLLALELAPRIRVNAIGPGLTIPGVQDTEASFRWMQEQVPLQRKSNPEEICRTVDFVLESPSLTGQHLMLSGGMHLKSLMPVRDLNQKQ